MMQMEAENTPFKWNQRSERAAVLLAEDLQTDEQIAAEVGVTRRALAKWKNRPEFAARVQDHLSAFRAQVRAEGIAVLENRILALNARWRAMQSVIKERADDPKMKDVPGGTTGLLVREETPTRYGPVVKATLDAALLAELRAHEMQAAKELGQLVDRSRVDLDSGASAESLERKLAALSDAELNAVIQGKREP